MASVHDLPAALSAAGARHTADAIVQRAVMAAFSALAAEPCDAAEQVRLLPFGVGLKPGVVPMKEA